MESKYFEFLVDVDNDLYRYMKSMESHTKVNYKEASSACRNAIERFVSLIAQKNNYKFNNMQLGGKIGELLNRGFLPKLYDVYFSLNNGEKRKADGVNFLRLYGNAVAHIGGDKDTLMKLNCRNSEKALETFYYLLTNVFKIKRKKINYDLIPLDNYYIEQSKIPNDSLQSKCLKEYTGYRLVGSACTKEYCIIREYKKETMDEIFLQRNMDTFTEMSRQLINGIQNGVSDVHELSSIVNEYCESYYIVYSFKKPPLKLSNKLLAKLNKIDRIKMCKKICDAMGRLHNAPTPIFHRLLSCESILLNDFSDLGLGYLPIISKFDFSKISTQGDAESYKTVINQLNDSKNIIDDQKMKSYIDPCSDSTWEKTDIYSLGELFGHILIGNLNYTNDLLGDMEDANIDDELINMVENMKSMISTDRMNINQVSAIIGGVLNG